MLSSRIKTLRIHSSLSQGQLAELLHISASAMGMYEQGRRTPDLNILVAMSQTFDVSLDFLITGKEHIYSDNMKVKAASRPCTSCLQKAYKA